AALLGRQPVWGPRAEPLPRGQCWIGLSPKCFEPTLGDLPAVRGPDETIEIAAGDDEHVTPIGAGPDVLRLQIADRIRRVSGERDENIADQVLGRRKGCQRAADPRLDRKISVSRVLIPVV